MTWGGTSITFQGTKTCFSCVVKSGYRGVGEKKVLSVTGQNKWRHAGTRTRFGKTDDWSLYARGQITMWAPPGDDEGEMELWRNRHEDGEEEDLEKHEVEEAIGLRRELDARADPSCKQPPAAALWFRS